MYLKSLEMQGFKSFPDRTKIQFHHGSTVIVGPNGSGKSNITDAMRWVLGEISSKNIRGAKMEDVVFAGAVGRNPMGYAEVSVTFDNTDSESRIDVPYDEVTVTRRYYKAGDGEYFINHRPCRLRDIHELFMNTGIGREGYSIIGQGRIAEIISRKSEDRRTIFEEAAGISKYRYKRQEAERQLESSEENMLRVNDILSEIESRVAPLEKEAEKAKKYLDLYERRRRADITLTVYDSKKIRDQQKQAEDDFILSTHELEMITDTVAGLEAQSERLSEASTDNKLLSERAYERIRELTGNQSKLEAEYGAMVADRARTVMQIEDSEHEVEKTDESIKSAIEEVSSVDAAIAEKKSALDTAERVLDGKKQKLSEEEGVCGDYARELEELLAEQKRHESAEVDLKVRISVLKGSVDSDEAKNLTVSEDIEKYNKAAEQLKLKADRESKNVSDFEDGISKSKAIIAELDGKIAELDREIENTKNDRSINSATVQSLDHRIDALVRLEENFEGYGKSVKFVMDSAASGMIKGKVIGPVSHIISVPDEYVTSVEIALGANLQNIVVDNEETAKSAIKCLKNNGAGRATFYPMTSIRAQEAGREYTAAAGAPGYLGLASDVISYDPQYTNIIKYLLGRTCIFDTIDNAAKAASSSGYKIRIVTLDGQQINAGGSFTGGSVRRDSGMLTRAGEIKSLRAERSLRIREGEKLDARISELTGKRTSESGKRTDEISRRDMMDTMMRAAMTSRDTSLSQYNATVSLVGELRADYETRAEMRGKYESDMRDFSEKLKFEEEKVREISEKRAELDVLFHEAEDRRDAASASVSESIIEINAIRSETDAQQSLLNEKIRRRDEFIARKNELLEKIEALKKNTAESESRLEENRSRVHEIGISLAEVEGEREKLESGGMEFEKRQVELRRRIREKSDEKENVMRTHLKNEQRKTHLSEQIDEMVSHLWDEYELTFTTAVELDYPPVTQENRAEVQRELTECKNKLRVLGAVNVNAIEEYKEVSERYEYLSRQMEDLRAAKENLMSVINDLNANMEREFADAFKRINEKFGDVFRELFGGGTAELYLSDPDNILSSGIEIKAAPPGKVIKNLSLLSGGEQAFVAIALLFAMIHVNPTPFCIFDEIESALDEVNVDRFAAYIKRYSEQMQFVIITHRRGTMETADSLYGITMPNHGISRVLTLDPNDMEAKSQYASASNA